jgi:uncharacterized integral membrane protein
MKHIKALLVILLVVLVVIVAVENIPNLKTPVVFSIDLGFGIKRQTPDIPLAVVAVVTFLVGVISMGLYGITERFRLKRQIKILLKEVKEKEKELDSLRNLPVTAEVVSPKTFDAE